MTSSNLAAMAVLDVLLVYGGTLQVLVQRGTHRARGLSTMQLNVAAAKRAVHLTSVARAQADRPPPAYWPAPVETDEWEPSATVITLPVGATFGQPVRSAA